MNALSRFVRSKSGLVLLSYLAISAAGSAGAAYQFYQSGLETFRAFAIDVPVAPFLEVNRAYSYGLGLCLFAVLAGLGLAFLIFRFRDLSGRDAAELELGSKNKRIQAALDNMGEGLCMFDGQKRLVVWNDNYAKWYQLPEDLLKVGTPHTAIISHRVSQGILDGETNTNAVENKISGLDQLPEGASSSRTDQLRDGRFICVTRQPLEGGGWVATHTDVTQEVNTDRALAELNREIDTVVQAAVQGDYSRRVDPGQADGVMLSLSEGMNRLLETVDRGLSDMVEVVSAMAQGDLTKRIEGDYAGSFLRLKDDTNSMADQIETIAGRISSVTGAVRGATREIAASQEQSAGIDQVSNAITNMDEVTQQNASLVEETTAALISAQTQLEDLRQAVGFFKTAENAKQSQQAEPREADTPAANAVHEQQHKLARRVSASGAAALAVDDEWKEF